MLRLPKGVHPILYALFDAEGRLDRTAMRRQIEICIEQGAVGITTLGLATEVRHLTAAERRRLIDWNAEDIAGRIPLGVTIFAPTSEDQIEAIEHAASAGANWVILQAPTAATDEESLAENFSEVLKSSVLPAALQNMPQFLGVGLSVGVIAQLAEKHANLIGVKQEVAATETAELVESVGGRLNVFSGRGGLELIDCMRAGITGHVPAPEYADRLIEIWRLMDAANEVAARDAYARILPVATFVLQSLESLTTYGKLLFCLRYDLPFHPRRDGPVPTQFGINALIANARHAGFEVSGWGRAIAGRIAC